MLAEVVEYRVAQWLPVGVRVFNPRLEALDVPTLVIAGEDDNFLPVSSFRRFDLIHRVSLYYDSSSPICSLHHIL